MIKSPVLLAVALLLATLIAVGYQVVELNRLRLKNMNTKVQSLDTQLDTQGSESTATQKLPSLAELAALNLMGAANKPVEKTVMQNIVPISALNLILIGTIVKSDEDKSSALIQRSNRETKRYFVGDIIEGGVALSSVAVGWVILKREDASEVLRYPQAAFSAASAALPDISAIVPASSPVAPNPAAIERMRAAAANNAAGNNSATNNSATNNATANKLPQLGGSRRLMNLRDRLKQQAPVNQQQTPPQQQTPSEQGDTSSKQDDAK